MIAVKVHYDGKTLILDEPVSLPLNTPLVAKFEDLAECERPKSTQKRTFGQFKGLMKMSADFNAPLPDSFWDGEE